MSSQLEITKEELDRLNAAAISSLKNPGMAHEELPKTELPNTPTLYVFRHGETYDNVGRIFSGWRDALLTPTGEEQAKMLGKKLRDKHIDLCITSDQTRSKETARIALESHAETKFEEDSRIKERSYGDLQGMSKEELMQKDPEKATLYRRGYDTPPPNGESLKMVEERVFPFCEDLVVRMKREKINVAIACHSNSMRAIRRYFEKMTVMQEMTHENPLGQDYAAYAIL